MSQHMAVLARFVLTNFGLSPALGGSPPPLPYNRHMYRTCAFPSPHGLPACSSTSPSTSTYSSPFPFPSSVSSTFPSPSVSSLSLPDVACSSVTFLSLALGQHSESGVTDGNCLRGSSCNVEEQVMTYMK